MYALAEAIYSILVEKPFSSCKILCHDFKIPRSPV
jgi:hypothetical protein